MSWGNPQRQRSVTLVRVRAVARGAITFAKASATPLPGSIPGWLNIPTSRFAAAGVTADGFGSNLILIVFAPAKV